jgi:hypothetical protein
MDRDTVRFLIYVVVGIVGFFFLARYVATEYLFY